MKAIPETQGCPVITGRRATIFLRIFGHLLSTETTARPAASTFAME